MKPERKFVVDGMLGKLARWLRILGYDTLFVGNSSDEEVLELLERDNSRVLLTKDRLLYVQAVKKGFEALLMEGTSIEDWLKQLQASKLIDLSQEREPRCSVCNAKLRKVSKNDVYDRLPEKTRELYDFFYECSRCRKLYWFGSHWKNIRRVLKRVASSVEVS